MNETAPEGTSFLLPDGWPTMLFFAESDKVSSRPATPMDHAADVRPTSPEGNINSTIFLNII